MAQTGAPAGERPKPGGSIVAAQETDPVALDPHGSSAFAAVQIFESFQVIRPVEPVDPDTVRMTLENPFAPLLANFASLRGSAIVPRKLIERGINLSQQAIGTSPFKLVEFVSQSHARYEKNPHYRERGLPYLGGLTLKIMGEEDSRVAGLRGGALPYVRSPRKRPTGSTATRV